MILFGKALIRAFGIVSVFFIYSFFVPQALYAQIHFTSANNQAGDWFDGAKWTPTTPNSPTSSSASSITINGYMRSESGLIINNANPVVTINDTLYVVGNVTLGSGASMNVPAGGILIVTGNLTLQGNFNMANGGNVVVKGNLNVTNGNVNNTANFYVFGSTSASGGGKVNGCDGFGNPGGCNPRTAGGIGNSTDLANNNPSLSDFVDNLGILPVELLHFYLEKNDKEVTLHWATASELNFDRFVVEKTRDGKTFVEIGEREGAGISTSRIDYSFTDKQPLLGRTYYRLKAIDFDGYTEYFGVVTANFEGAEQLIVAPNPAVGNDVKFQLNYSAEGALYCRVLNASGDQVFSSFIQPNGFDSEYTIGKTLTSGLYFLIVQQGQERKTVRFVVN